MDYREIQIGEETIKPIHYHIGEWLAINHFFSKVASNVDTQILDLGCGIGYGVGMFNKLGYGNVIGIDLNPKKIEIAEHLRYNVMCCDFMTFDDDDYDVIWCSHSFEHMAYPKLAIQKLLDITNEAAEFYFILPYPDLSPAPAHCSSKELGLDKDNKGRTVIDWFKSKGLNLETSSFSDFRESEIWLSFTKL